MEEHVGQWWHRAITRVADRSHQDAAIKLCDMRRSVAMLYRAGGGDATTRVAEAASQAHAGPRGWLQRIAGSGTHQALTQLDDDTLALPPQLAVFDEPALNRQLYLWLAAMAACFDHRGHWLRDNLQASGRALQRFPGLRTSYLLLVERLLAQRAAPRKQAQVLLEQKLHELLKVSVSSERLNAKYGEPLPAMDIGALDPTWRGEGVEPVWIWLYPSPHARVSATMDDDDAHRDQERESTASSRAAHEDRRRRHAERVRDHRDHAPLVLPFRVESLLSFAELVKVNRADDDREDEDPTAAANDLDTIAVAPDGQRASSRVKFDLDLPSAAHDDTPLGEGHLLPEWDHRAGVLRADHCRVQWLQAKQTHAFVPSPELSATAKQLRRRLSALRSAPRLLRGLPDGDMLDVDAWVRYQNDRRVSPLHDDAPPVLMRHVRGERSLATLLLADLSLSTESPIGRAHGDRRIIDVIRDALYAFGEALDAANDPFEMLGFCSVRRQHVRIQHLKTFDEKWDAAAHARIGAIKPGYYTRMGAALREGTLRLSKRSERQRLLLILTDGKPNDIDIYEGRYGLEDTRRAVIEARRAGLLPFAVTIDQHAHDYLPLLFGQQGFVVVRRPQDLATRLSKVYAQLTREEHAA